jgi:RHS repeat-associated protein
VRQKFTGYERDIETNLDYAKARFHNSILGRFQSPDRYSTRVLMSNGFDLRLFSVQPQNWNSYSYCRNNPTKYVDPNGEHPLVAVAIIGGVIGAVAGGGIEYAKQKWWDGKEEVDWGKVGGAAIQGGIFGAVAGLTGGAGLALPVRQQIAALTVANVGGGLINRGISNQQILNPTAIVVDAASGAVAGYLAGIGQTRYFNSYSYQSTEATRVAQAEAVDLLMVSSPIPSIMPTMTRPVVQEAIKDASYNGIREGIYVGSYRTTGKVGTERTLNFLFDFDIARPVQTAGNNQTTKKSTSKDGDLNVTSGCAPRSDGKGLICGPTIID